MRKISYLSTFFLLLTLFSSGVLSKDCKSSDHRARLSQHPTCNQGSFQEENAYHNIIRSRARWEPSQRWHHVQTGNAWRWDRRRASSIPVQANCTVLKHNAEESHPHTQPSVLANCHNIGIHATKDTYSTFTTCIHQPTEIYPHACTGTCTSTWRPGYATDNSWCRVCATQLLTTFKINEDWLACQIIQYYIKTNTDCGHEQYTVVLECNKE